MSDSVVCPVCRNTEGGSCQEAPKVGDYTQFRCDICGLYEAEGLALATTLHPQEDLTLIQRALISHHLRKISSEEKPLRITPEWLAHLLSNGRLPRPAEQAANFIRYIGDEVSRSGKAIATFPIYIYAVIGAPDYNAVIRLTKELEERKILTADPLGTVVRHDNVTGLPRQDFTNISLSLDGWEQYEAEKRGKFEGHYGFIAMQFDDPELDPFMRDVVKPAVEDGEEGIGYKLVDMRDVGRAGVIDNIMRTQIRDAAFVIVDLTHDNSGAYWEAGYAEGLGKPVLYICEKTKFEEARTHFDTNHCTTVLWSRDDDEGFKKALVATLRRSLDL